jgi:hypothetical protein
MKAKAYLALFLVEHPQYEGCSYEECKKEIKRLYNVDIEITALEKLYIPFYYLQENLTLHG